MSESTRTISLEVTQDTAVDALVAGFFSVIDMTSQRMEGAHGGLNLSSVFEALLTTYCKVVESALDDVRPPVLTMVDLDSGARYLLGTAGEYGKALLAEESLPDTIRKPVQDYMNTRPNHILKLVKPPEE